MNNNQQQFFYFTKLPLFPCFFINFDPLISPSLATTGFVDALSVLTIGLSFSPVIF